MTWGIFVPIADMGQANIKFNEDLWPLEIRGVEIRNSFLGSRHIMEGPEWVTRHLWRILHVGL